MDQWYGDKCISITKACREYDGLGAIPTVPYCMLYSTGCAANSTIIQYELVQVRVHT